MCLSSSKEASRLFWNRMHITIIFLIFEISVKKVLEPFYIYIGRITCLKKFSIGNSFIKYYIHFIDLTKFI